MSEPSKVGLRLRSARAKAKGRGILTEVFEAAETTRAVLIAGNRDGSNWTVVPVGMTARDLGEAMMAGAFGVQRFAENEKAIGRVGMPVRIEVTERGDGKIAGTSDPLPRETRVGPDGSLQAPDGEAFSYCGECGGTRWYSTSRRDSGLMARMVCVGCGNELRVHAMTHGEEGHA